MIQLTDTDLKILNTARKMFLEQGIMQTDMKALAKELGCSRSTLYRHFASKADILIILAENALDIISQSTYIPDGLRFNTSFDAFSWQLNSMTECLIQHPEELIFLREFDCLYYKEFSVDTLTDNFESQVSLSAQKSPLLDTFKKGLGDKSIAPTESPELAVLTIIHGMIALAQRVMPAEHTYLRQFGYGQEMLRQAETFFLCSIKNNL